LLDHGGRAEIKDRQMMLPSLAGLVLAAALSMGDPFTYEYAGQTDASGTAYVVIVANENFESLDVTISGDGQTITKSLSMGKGSRKKIEWKQKSGQAKYDLKIKGQGMDADFTFEIVKTAVMGKVGKLKVKSSREDIVKRHQATYESSFALSSYEYKIYDIQGDIVDSKQVAGADVAAGGTFTITWDSPVEIFMIDVRGEDEFGRFTEYKLVPWAVEIPHTEINFDSGKSDIKPGEVPKLDEAVAVAFHELDGLDRVNKAVQANLVPQLYIVGYTDTVGPTGSNDKLSNSRAKAIAKYFYDQGFWAEIFYAGLGERALRVETDDNVDEVRNRRALYLIGVQKPPAGGQVPSRWTRLAGPRDKPAGFVLPELPPELADYREKRASGGDAAPAGDGGGGDDGSDDPSASADTFGAFNDSSSDNSADDGGGAADGGGPPAVEGEPGAAKKGCSVSTDVPNPMSLGLWALLLTAPAFRRRRRA
jgi:MYXO-CTERM domain-containing protein